jgi:hypothetical protein
MFSKASIPGSPAAGGTHGPDTLPGDIGAAVDTPAAVQRVDNPVGDTPAVDNQRGDNPVGDTPAVGTQRGDNPVEDNRVERSGDIPAADNRGVDNLVADMPAAVGSSRTGILAIVGARAH